MARWTSARCPICSAKQCAASGRRPSFKAWRARCLLAATPGRLHRRGAAPVARSSRAIRTAASTTRRCATWCISGPPDGTWPGRPRRGCLVSRSATTSTSRGPWRRRASTCRTYSWNASIPPTRTRWRIGVASWTLTSSVSGSRSKGDRSRSSTNVSTQSTGPSSDWIGSGTSPMR